MFSKESFQFVFFFPWALSLPPVCLLSERILPFARDLCWIWWLSHLSFLCSLPVSLFFFSVPCPLSYTDIAQITPLLPGARRSKSTTTATVWRGRRTRRRCCCGRTSQTTTCRSASPRPPAQTAASPRATAKLPIQWVLSSSPSFLKLM